MIQKAASLLPWYLQGMEAFTASMPCSVTDAAACECLLVLGSRLLPAAQFLEDCQKQS